MDEKKNGLAMRDLLTYNALRYQLPTNLNVVERRTLKISFSDQQSYSSGSGSELVVRLTSSTDYIYGKNSFLAFDVQAFPTGGGGENDPYGFVNGTALSLFQRMLFEDRSGSELERNDQLGRFAWQYLQWKNSLDQSRTSQAMGGQYRSKQVVTDTDGLIAEYPLTFVANGTEAAYDCTAGPVTCCIPLSWFLGIFDCETLIPATLISGALLRLQLASPIEAFTALGATTATGLTYQITNPRVVLDSLSLAPVVQKNLMEASQLEGGLPYVYKSFYYQSASPGTATNFSLQVNKAVSRCSKLIWSNRLTNAPTLGTDSLGTNLFDISQLDYRLGSEYFPQRVISVTDPIRGTSEVYENSLQSMMKLSGGIQPQLSKCIFSRSADATGTQSSVVHVQSFEQSSALEYSGMAINNSRTLEARIVFQSAGAPGRVIDAWIEYLKVALTSQLRAVIKE